MKQQNSTQNLWQLWLDAIRVELAYLRVMAPESSQAKVIELQELMLRISPMADNEVNESS